MEGKTGVCDVAFGRATAVALRRYLRAWKGSRYADTDALWVGDRGPIGYPGVQLMLTSYSKRAGVGHIPPPVPPHVRRVLEGIRSQRRGLDDVGRLADGRTASPLRGRGQGGACAEGTHPLDRL